MAIDGVRQNTNTYVSQTSGSEQASSAASGSIMPQSGAEQVSGEKSYTKDQVSGTENAKKISLYKDIKKILEDNNVKLNLTENDLATILATVCNKNADDLTDDDIEKIKTQIADIAKVFNYNKGETLENLLFANDQVNVINIKSSVDKEIAKGADSSYLNHKSVSETIEGYYTKDVGKGGFKNLTEEQKIYYIQKFVKWSGTKEATTEKNVTEQDNIERQAGTFRKLLCGTKDKEDRKLLLEAIEVMYKENQAPAFAELLASFSDIEDKQEVAGKAVDEGKTDKYIDGATKEQAAEIINVIAQATDDDHSQKLNTQLNEKLKEFVEANKDELVVIAKKIENGEEDFTDEEKKIQAIYESLKGANGGKDSGFLGNEYIRPEIKTQLVNESYRTYIEIDKQTGLNIKTEMMKSLNTYIEEHPEVNITKEQLATIVTNAENKNISDSVSGQGSSSEDVANSETVVAQANKGTVPFKQKAEKEDVETIAESVERRRNELELTPLRTPKIVITPNTTLSSAYDNYGILGALQYGKVNGVSFITEAFSTKVAAQLQDLAGNLLKHKSKKDQVAAFTEYGVDRNAMEPFLKESIITDSIPEANSLDARKQMERML